MSKTFLPLLLASSAFVGASPIKARQSGGKRGLPYNDGAVTNLFSKEKISWMYNWDSIRNDGASPDLMFVPMLHSDEPVHTDRWNDNVEKSISEGATAVFSFNEPDQCGGGGSCMQDVGRTVASHKQWIQPLADKHPNVKFGAPAVTNGVANGNGGAMGIPYLKQFLEQCTDCRIDFVNAHWYDSADNVAYFKKHLNDIHDASGKDVWLTEFAPTSGDAEKFLAEVLPWMDETSWITHYAYHFAAPGVLVNDASNGLTAIGNAYQSV